MRRLGFASWVPFLSLIVLLAASAAGADPASARAGRLESGCSTGCLREGGDARYCAAYCGCVRREVFTGRSRGEVDALFAVMRADAPESPAKRALYALMDGCVEEADAP